MIDLRTDTVTQPSAGMREAMACAHVGDEQKQEDPTVLALQDRAAALLGQERAVFVPTATMANQIALQAAARPGEEIIAEAQAHVLRAEAGGPAANSGLTAKRIQGDRGIFGAEALRASISPDDPHMPPSRVVCVENTHNGGGGSVWLLERIQEVALEARQLRLHLHLDGARLMNAVVSSDTSAADYGAPFDTVTLCFSKGLGCPLGAVLACSEALWERVWRLKFLFGGAMRQAGIVAAACLHALDHNVERLAQDHARARRLAEGWARAGLPVRPALVESNFVMIECADFALDREQVRSRLAAAGVLVSAAAQKDELRAVTHLDITDEDIDCAIDAASVLTAAAAPCGNSQ